MTDDAADLVRRAFEMARQTGKPDWRRMTTPVLKNRLLSLTQREFRESEYGARTFREFVELLGDSVQVHRDVTPWVVELPPDVAGLSAPSGSFAESEQVRSDLWRAVLDYSSGRKYVWDDEQAIAREYLPTDGEKPVLPTVSPEVLTTWRAEFVQRNESTTPDKTKLQVWAERGLPTASLPPQLRGEWNAELKRRVGKTLRNWFEEHGLRMPADAFSLKRDSVDEGREARLRALRRLVLDCVAVMTEAELSDLRLPPKAILRARGAHRE